MIEKKKRPKEVPLVLYSVLRDFTPNSLRQFFIQFFFTISPDVPYDLSKRISEKHYWRVIVYGCAISIIFCFFLTAAFCYSEGVLYSQQGKIPSGLKGEVKYFLNDNVNIIMYTVITPLTVGIGLALLLATINTWQTLDHCLERQRNSLLNWKGFILVSLIIVASSVVISNYINDIVNTNTELGEIANKHHYWFLGNPQSEVLIKPITIFYTILNFVILVFTLSCIAMFVTAIRPIVKLSDLISSHGIKLVNSQKDLLDRLACFADVYLFAKILLAITMVHSIVWSYSPLAVTSNFNLERGFIVFVSIFFISVPRLHFELAWYRSALKYKKLGVNIDLKPDYIHGFNYYAIWIADYLIIGSYAVSLTGILNFGPYASIS